jgi:phosphoglycolate phosphatase-like HAD superfamily hydrolase
VPELIFRAQERRKSLSEQGQTIIVDIDGTLVDSNYHHALAWSRALRRVGVVEPLWRIHRHIGMGGDKMVAAVAGEGVEEEHGDEIREAEGELFAELIGEVAPLEGARTLLEALQAAGHSVVLASSAKESEAEHYLDLLDARELVEAWTTSADVEATKPAPDLVGAACEKASGEAAWLLGDTPWDVEAAAKLDVATIAVLSGGYGEAELLEAGAVAVLESVREIGPQLFLPATAR